MRTAGGFPLNGCDTFMLAMDRDMRRLGSPGNICHLLVSFESGTDVHNLMNTLKTLPFFQYLVSLRLHTPLLGTPQWRPTSGETPLEYPHGSDLHTHDDLRRSILSHSIDVTREAPYGVVPLPRFAQGPSLLFYWHHALCDAHGGEKLLALFAKGDGSISTPLTRALESRRACLARARDARNMIFSKALPTIGRFAPVRDCGSELSIEKVIFSSEETARFTALSETVTNGIFPTALLLAATARAAVTTTKSSYNEMLVPVPHDLRRLTRERSPLSNQVSFIFFRLRERSLHSLTNATNDIIGQLQEAITSSGPQAMLSFLRVIRRLPLWLFWKIIETPTNGHPASFYFSDIGDSLSSIDTFLGAPIQYATHYPPVLSPPGLTTVWSRYRGLLEVTVCYDNALFGAHGVAPFIVKLKEELCAELTSTKRHVA